jgi:ribonuclease R
LRNDYYRFDPVGQRLHGERSGQVYRLGDSLRVRVTRVDLDERKIDFEPIESGAQREKRWSPIPRSRGRRKKE